MINALQLAVLRLRFAGFTSRCPRHTGRLCVDTPRSRASISVDPRSVVSSPPVPLSLRERGDEGGIRAHGFRPPSRNSGCFDTQSDRHSRIIGPLRHLRPAQRFALARALRHRPTPAERHAWTLLRNRGILGLKFRRQHVLHGFIVDFYCASERVVIELEGSVHDGAARQSYDRARGEFLAAAGYRVIRVRNKDVSRDHFETVLRELSDLAVSSPSPEGRGGQGVRTGAVVRRAGALSVENAELMGAWA